MTVLADLAVEGTTAASELQGIADLAEADSTRISGGQRQLVLIARALAQDARVVVMDEPTASLNENDSQKLLGLLREFRAQGIACILISHKLKEVESIADTITVLRDGAVIESLDAKADLPLPGLEAAPLTYGAARS